MAESRLELFVSRPGLSDVAAGGRGRGALGLNCPMVATSIPNLRDDLGRRRYRSEAIRNVEAGRPTSGRERCRRHPWRSDLRLLATKRVGSWGCDFRRDVS